MRDLDLVLLSIYILLLNNMYDGGINDINSYIPLKANKDKRNFESYYKNMNTILVDSNNVKTNKNDGKINFYEDKNKFHKNSGGEIENYISSQNNIENENNQPSCNKKIENDINKKITSMKTEEKEPKIDETIDSNKFCKNKPEDIQNDLPLTNNNKSLGDDVENIKKDIDHIEINEKEENRTLTNVISEKFKGCKLQVTLNSNFNSSGEVIFNFKDILVLKNDMIIFVNPDGIDIFK